MYDSLNVWFTHLERIYNIIILTILDGVIHSLTRSLPLSEIYDDIGCIWRIDNIRSTQNGSEVIKELFKTKYTIVTPAHVIGPGIILDSLKMGVNHCLITSRTISENIWEAGVTVVIFRMIHSMIESLEFWVNPILSQGQSCYIFSYSSWYYHEWIIPILSRSNINQHHKAVWLYCIHP